VNSDDALDALDGERELLVAAQRDDETPRLAVTARPFFTLILDDERGRVEHGAHAPAQGYDAEDCARRARQRRGPRAGLRLAVSLFGADGEELTARAQQQKLARLQRPCVFV
jgi:hypothetical protein